MSGCNNSNKSSSADTSKSLFDVSDDTAPAISKAPEQPQTVQITPAGKPESVVPGKGTSPADICE